MILVFFGIIPILQEFQRNHRRFVNRDYPHSILPLCTLLLKEISILKNSRGSSSGLASVSVLRGGPNPEIRKMEFLNRYIVGIVTEKQFAHSQKNTVLVLQIMNLKLLIVKFIRV